MKNNDHSVRYSHFSACLLAGAFLSGLLGCHSDAPPKDSPDRRSAAVRVVAFGQEGSRDTLEFTGTLQENRSVPISFQVGGRVISVHVSEGDTLARGSLIAMVDTQSLADAYRVAEAKWLQAQDAHQRMQPLHDSGALSAVQWVEVQTALKQTQAMADLARRNLEDARLRAPVNGIVLRRKLEVGQSVMPGLPVLQLVDPDYLDAVFAVSGSEILHVRKGMPIQVIFSGNPEEIHEGIVNEIGVSADPVSRTYPLRVRLGNPGGNLRLGMACRSVMPLPDSEASRMVLPFQAVLEKADGTRYVHVVHEGKVEERVIRIGGFLGKGVRVLDGLAPGEQVVVEGTHGLAQGAAVTVKN